MGNCVRIFFLLLLLQPQIISLNFLNKALVALPLILLTIFDLKIRTLLNLVGLYFLNLKTPLIIRLLISYLSDAWKGAFGVIIRPSFQSCFTSLKLAFSLAVIKAINNLTLFLIAVINYSLKLIRYWRFCNPFRRPLPRYSYGMSTTIISESQSPFRACWSQFSSKVYYLQFSSRVSFRASSRVSFKASSRVSFKAPFRASYKGLKLLSL